MTKTGNYSDIAETAGNGRRISWNDVSHFDDDAMRNIIRQIGVPVYTFQVKSEDPCVPEGDRTTVTSCIQLG